MTYDDDDTTPRIVKLADAAYEALRSFNHATLGSTIPAPVAYDVLGNLKGVGHLMPQALDQLTQGLGRSLDAYDVYDKAEGRTPEGSVALVADHLLRASELAAQLGAELDAAQTAIALQGYRPAEESTE